MGAPSSAKGWEGQGGSARLFQNIKGHPGHQALINQFGSARRMNLALEVDSLDEVAARIRALHGHSNPPKDFWTK